MANTNVLYRLLAENVDFLLWESEASDQAKELGLSYAGFGYWKDHEEHIVARTVAGKLVKLAPGEEPELADNDYHADHEPDEAWGSAGATAAEVAMQKLTTAALEYMDVESVSATYAATRPVAKAIVHAAVTGKLYVSDDSPFDQDQKNDLYDFIKNIVIGNKNSKLVKAIAAFGNLKASTAAPEPKNDDLYFDEKLSQLIGFDYVNASKSNKDTFEAIADKAEKAETSVQINYVRALLKKSGLLGTDEETQWETWKKVLKFLKSEKQGTLIKGPKHAGKIKNKNVFDVPGDIHGPSIDPEELKKKIKIMMGKDSDKTNPPDNSPDEFGFVPGTDDGSPPINSPEEPEEIPHVDQSETDLGYMKWFKSLDPSMVQALKNIWYEFLTSTGKDQKQYGLSGQGKLLQGIVTAATYKDSNIINQMSNVSDTDKAILKNLAEKQFGEGIFAKEIPAPNPVGPAGKGKSYITHTMNYPDTVTFDDLSGAFDKFYQEFTNKGAENPPIDSQGKDEIDDFNNSFIGAFVEANPGDQKAIKKELGKFVDATGIDLNEEQTGILEDALAAYVKQEVSQEDVIEIAKNNGVDPALFAKHLFNSEYEEKPFKNFADKANYINAKEPAKNDPEALAQAQKFLTPSPDAQADFQKQDIANATQEIAGYITKEFPEWNDLITQAGSEFTGIISTSLNEPTFAAGSKKFITWALAAGFGTEFALKAEHMLYTAFKKKEKGEPMSTNTVAPDNDAAIEEPTQPTDLSPNILKKALAAGMLTVADFTPETLSNAHAVIQAALDAPKPDDAKKLVKDLAGTLGLSKDEFKALYGEVFKQRAEKFNVGKTDKPLADVDVPAPFIKGVEKSLTTWAKGDIHKVAAWINSKIKADPEKNAHLSWQAAALVKYHGLDPNEVMDVLPKEIKAKLGDKIPVTIEKKVNDAAMAFQTKMGGKLWGKDIEKIKDALTIGISTGDLSKLDDLIHTTNLAPMEIEALKDIIKPAEQEPEFVPEPDEPEPVPQAPVEKPQPTMKVNSKNAAEYAQNFLATIGTSWEALGGEKQVQLIDAIKNALNVPDEFGVMYHLSQLAKHGVLDQDTVDAITFDILNQKEEEGTLDKDPDTYKKYLDPHFAVDQFLNAIPGFAQSLSAQDKKKLYDTAAIGLAMKGADGYQKSKAFYQQELLGKVPGFNEEVFQKFRNSLMQYHDSLKVATQQIAQKKAEVQAKIQAEKELQKALDALGKGDAKQQVDSLVAAAGLNSIPSSDQMKVKVAVMKALTAPSSQDMMDELDKLKGQAAYGGASFGKEKQAWAAGAVHSVPSTSLNLLKKLVASQYQLDKDHFHQGQKEPQISEPIHARTKRVLRNWLKKTGYSIANFPSKEFSHDEKGKIVSAVEKALVEKDPKKVSPILNDLHTTTSINDDQILALKKMVHGERQNPESLKGVPVPDSNIPKHGVTASATQPTGKPGIKGLEGDKEYSTMAGKYGIPPAKASEAHEAIVNALANLTMGNKISVTKNLKYALLQTGMSEPNAKNLSNAIARYAIKGGPLVQKASDYITKKYAPTAGQSLPQGADQKQAKAYVASIPSHQDPYNFAKNEWVKGEEVKVSGHLAWSVNQGDDMSNGVSAAKKQDQWRKDNLKHDDNVKYNWAADSWQGSSQWVKSPESRKAINHIMHKAIEGPPPMLTDISGFVERGLRVKAEDFGDFIAAFELGKRVYLGPSGFSAHTSTPRGYCGHDHGYSNQIGVLLRINPPKSGKMKGGRLAERSAHNMFGGEGGEMEMVMGTNRQTRVSRVVKHVTKHSSGTRINYEIIMDYDDSLNEAQEIAPMMNGGFRADLWQGVPRNTVKAIIKYINGPLPKE